MRFTLAPMLEELMDALQQEGWCVGDVAIDGVWVVYCTKGEHVLHSTDKDRTMAWSQAVDQARLIGTVNACNN